MASLQLAVLLFFSFLAFKVASSIWRSRRFNSFERAHGCQKPHNLSGNWPWPISTLHGIKTIRRMLKLKTSGEDILDDIVQEQFKDAHTVSQVGFEGSTFMVCCPKVRSLREEAICLLRDLRRPLSLAMSRQCSPLNLQTSRLANEESTSSTLCLESPSSRVMALHGRTRELYLDLNSFVRTSTI